ncbi:MAG: CDP-alcohol phosphatidyltransferase family protein [Alphaproteobacteria bacterium]
MTASPQSGPAHHVALPAILAGILAGSGASAFDSPLGLAVGFHLYLLVLAAALLAAGPERRRNFGTANRITLLRGALTAILAAAAAAGSALTPDHLWLAFGCAVIALALDGVDGWFARRTGRADDFGARFDMEVDALLILVLSVLLWSSDRAGLWVLSAGLLRYAFILAGRMQPWIARPLPPSRRRQAACAGGVALLAAALVPALPTGLALASAGTATALLAGSFAIDLLWLARTARQD